MIKLEDDYQKEATDPYILGKPISKKTLTLVGIIFSILILATYFI